MIWIGHGQGPLYDSRFGPAWHLFLPSGGCVRRHGKPRGGSGYGSHHAVTRGRRIQD
jgi:hypothetical protein